MTLSDRDAVVSCDRSRTILTDTKIIAAPLMINSMLFVVYRTQ
jgi:hypothetical protein